MKRSLLLLALPLMVSISACAADAEDEDGGDVGDSTAALSNPCKLSRSQIAAGAGSAARQRAIQRGFGWLDANVSYSQSKYYASYRTDCSGFISMAWELGTSYTTANFINGGGQSYRLGGFKDLVPGDAIVRRSNGAGHIVMFLGWNDSSKSSACVLEQASTAEDMQFRTRTVSSLNASGYKAIRANKLRNASGGNANVPAGNDDDGADDDDNTPNDDAAGATCRGDGDCNPGNNGSGKICTGGRCVSGCRSDVQCPGSKTCQSGQCR